MRLLACKECREEPYGPPFVSGLNGDHGSRQPGERQGTPAACATNPIYRSGPRCHRLLHGSSARAESSPLRDRAPVDSWCPSSAQFIRSATLLPAIRTEVAQEVDRARSHSHGIRDATRGQGATTDTACRTLRAGRCHDYRGDPAYVCPCWRAGVHALPGGPAQRSYRSVLPDQQSGAPGQTIG